MGGETALPSMETGELFDRAIQAVPDFRADKLQGIAM
jgi:hypothetical protein